MTMSRVRAATTSEFQAQAAEGDKPSDRRLTVGRRRLLTGGSIVAASLVGQSLLGSSALGAAGTELSVGKVDITPAVDTYLAGYGVDEPRKATGTAAPLFARCTILWHAGVPHVIVTADVLGFARGLHRSIRSQVLALGLASENFALTATHTHNGPVLPDKLDPFISYAMNSTLQAQVRAYGEQLATKIVQLVRDTLEGPRTACTLDYQVVDQHFSKNRESLPYVESDVPVLTARTPGGEPLAVLFSYGCHPVVAGSQTMFDPDYPGTRSPGSSRRPAPSPSSFSGQPATRTLLARGVGPSGVCGAPSSRRPSRRRCCGRDGRSPARRRAITGR